MNRHRKSWGVVVLALALVGIGPIALTVYAVKPGTESKCPCKHYDPHTGDEVCCTPNTANCEICSNGYCVVATAPPCKHCDGNGNWVPPGSASPGKECCGGTEFDPSSQGCCSYTDSGGTVHYSVRDLATQICCGGVPVTPGPQPPCTTWNDTWCQWVTTCSAGELCCANGSGGTCYDPELLCCTPSGSLVLKTPIITLSDCPNRAQLIPPNPNGCSTPTGNNPCGQPCSSFLDACNQHDICYQTCGSDKTSCDGAFQGNMLMQCGTCSPDTNLVACCVSWANIYAVAVTLVGDPSYQSDQINFCKCCP
jgi:hypothetical protein